MASPSGGAISPEEALAADEMIQWCLASGTVMKRRSGGEAGDVIHAPFALHPLALPRRLYDRMLRAQPLFNVLVHEMTREAEWLDGICKRLAAGDAFTGRLYDIWRRTRSTSPASGRIEMSIHRSDYMLHCEEGGELTFKQVEMNTISASFAHLATRIAGHQRARGEVDVVENDASNRIAAAFDRATDLFLQKHAGLLATKEYCNSPPVNIIVVQGAESNIYDQQGVVEQCTVPFIRLTLSEVATRCSLGEGGLLCYSEAPGEGSTCTRPVLLVYFRAGYTPDDYIDDACWEARVLIEKSLAVAVPSIATHLAGMKKVQQEVARPGALERFVPSGAGRGDLLASTFVNIYSLDDDAEGDANAAMALAHPAAFVVKPMREGGGNNYFGESIVALLGHLSRTERSAHILMDLITGGEPQQNVLYRDALGRVCRCISEVGIYGIDIWDGPSVMVLNEAAGYLVRTKEAGVAEGGVMSGYAHLASLSLVDGE